MATVTHLGLFPSVCVQDISDIPFNNPFGLESDMYREMTKEQAMALYWRVKSWTVDVDGIDQNGNQYGKNNIELSRYGINKESDLVCHNPFNTVIFETYDEIFGGVIGGPTLILCMVFEQFGGDFNTPEDSIAGIKKDGELYYPTFYALATDIDMTTFQYFNLDGTVIGQAQLDMKSLGDNFYWSVYGNSINNSTMNLTFRASEFWEYDPNDGGGPIYDKDTGERIRSDV